MWTSALSLYNPGHHKASWLFLKGNYFLQIPQILLKSQPHWGKGGAIGLGPLCFCILTTWQTLPSSPKAGLNSRRLAPSSTLSCLPLATCSVETHIPGVPQRLPAPAESTRLPCTPQRGVWLQECQGRPCLGVLKTDGLVFLSVEVAAWGCQARDVLLEGVEGKLQEIQETQLTGMSESLKSRMY